MSVATSVESKEGFLSLAIFIKTLLSVFQLVAGMLSGSLSLVADALHNLADAGAIVVALVAKRIGDKKPDNSMTFGYKRAEIVGVLINSTSLVAVGIFLMYQAATRFFHPEVVDGWVVFWVAGFGFFVDLATALLTYYAGAKTNMNIRAVFVHNAADALASIAVIIAALFIIIFDFYRADVIITAGISIYIIYQGVILLRRSVRIVMQAVPEGICVDTIKQMIESLEHVSKVHHIHVWQLDETKIYFEGYISLATHEVDEITSIIRNRLQNEFSITHVLIDTSY